MVKSAEVSVTRLGQGIEAYKVHDYSGAVQQLNGVQSQVPKLADYTAWYLGSSQMQTGDAAGALQTLEAYRANPVKSSPLAGRIDVLHARALLEQHTPASNKKALD